MPEVGAPHRRDRLWIVAHNDDNRRWHRQDQHQRIAERNAAAYTGETREVADANGTGRTQQWGSKSVQQERSSIERSGQDVAYPESSSQTQQSGIVDGETLERASTGASGGTEHGHSAAGVFDDRRTTASGENVLAHTNSSERHGGSSSQQVGWKQIEGSVTPDGITGGVQWSIEPDVGRVAHGVAARVDRLRTLGNGQVPAVVRAAWLLMYQ
jgi:DNA (cytosine-5)-methyltransferase 1